MLEHLKEKLHEELCGAAEYIKSALESKAEHPNWAKMFMDMSSAELNHASNLYKMSEEYYKTAISTYSTPPKYIEDIWKEIVDCYVTKGANVRAMQEMYNK
jgi:ferritin